MSGSERESEGVGVVVGGPQEVEVAVVVEARLEVAVNFSQRMLSSLRKRSGMGYPRVVLRRTPPIRHTPEWR